MFTLSTMTTVSTDQLARVLDRGKQKDTLGVKIAQAIELLDKVIDDLMEQAIAISFNGGKDCTVLLHLFAAVLYARHSKYLQRASSQTASTISRPSPHQTTHKDQINPVPPQANGHSSSIEHIPSPPSSSSTQLYPPIRSIYITAPNSFPALETFVDECATRYNLDLYRFGGGMKAALTDYLEYGGGKGVKGVIVGTRIGDPNGSEPFDYPVSLHN